MFEIWRAESYASPETGRLFETWGTKGAAWDRLIFLRSYYPERVWSWKEVGAQRTGTEGTV